MKIEQPFSEEKASEIIIKLGEFAGHKDGMVKVWVGNGTPAQFYAVFNKTIAQKPLIGTDEWTFEKQELEKIDKVGQEDTDVIEVKLANRLVSDNQRALGFTKDKDGNKLVKHHIIVGLSEGENNSYLGFDRFYLEQGNLTKDLLHDIVKSQLQNSKEVSISSLNSFDYLFMIENHYAIPVKQFHEKQFNEASDDLIGSLNQIILEVL